MENQHRKITGYRELSAVEIELMNRIKGLGVEIERTVGEVKDHIDCASDLDLPGNRERTGDAQRWAAIARTDFQTALMALTRAVAQPTSF